MCSQRPWAPRPRQRSPPSSEISHDVSNWGNQAGTAEINGTSVTGRQENSVSASLDVRGVRGPVGRIRLVSGTGSLDNATHVRIYATEWSEPQRGRAPGPRRGVNGAPSMCRGSSSTSPTTGPSLMTATREARCFPPRHSVPKTSPPVWARFGAKSDELRSGEHDGRRPRRQEDLLDHVLRCGSGRPQGRLGGGRPEREGMADYVSRLLRPRPLARLRGRVEEGGGPEVAPRLPAHPRAARRQNPRVPER